MHLSQLFGIPSKTAVSGYTLGQGRQQQRNARYQTLLNSVSCGIYSCDATGLITYCNKEATELWGRQPALGDKAERFCGSHRLYRSDGRYLPHDQSPMADVLARKVSGYYDAEMDIQRPDGSRIATIVNIAPLIDDKGNINGAFCSFCEDPRRKFKTKHPEGMF